VVVGISRLEFLCKKLIFRRFERRERETLRGFVYNTDWREINTTDNIENINIIYFFEGERFISRI
jgi:hypothetical protein